MRCVSNANSHALGHCSLYDERDGTASRPYNPRDRYNAWDRERIEQDRDDRRPSDYGRDRRSDTWRSYNDRDRDRDYRRDDYQDRSRYGYACACALVPCVCACAVAYARMVCAVVCVCVDAMVVRRATSGASSSSR